MTNSIIIFLLLISLITTVVLLTLTVFRCRSEKKNYFLFCLIGMLFYVLGNYLEVSSHSVEAALYGVKVMYVGSTFMPPLFLLFIFDYCELLKLNKRTYILRACLLGLTFAALIIVWTTDKSGLMYEAYSYTQDTAIRGLRVDLQGPAYYPIFCYLMLCIVVSVAALATRIRKWNRRYRLPLFLLMLAAAAPLIANIIFILNTYLFTTSIHGINFTPYALIITNLLVYMNVLRYDLFDFTPRARMSMLDMIRDGLVFLDTDMRYISSNNIARELFPGLLEISKGDSITCVSGWPAELSHLSIGADPENDPTADRRKGSSRRCDDRKDIRFTLCGASERYFNAWVHTVISAKKPLGLSVLIQDVTDNVILINKLEEAAYTDGLTGLFNRRYFMELAETRLASCREQGTPCSMLIFDLDFFKSINDVYGHLAGDEVLRYTANTVKHAVRATDILGRYGGEEFVVFMSEELSVACKLAERIRACVETMSCRFEDQELRVTCSIGAAYGDGIFNVEQLIDRADTALYEAKQRGRNRVCVAYD